MHILPSARFFTAGALPAVGRQSGYQREYSVRTFKQSDLHNDAAHVPLVGTYDHSAIREPHMSNVWSFDWHLNECCASADIVPVDESFSALSSKRLMLA